jgi:HEAT repeat protein
MTNEDRLAALLAEADEDQRWYLLDAFVRSETSAARAAAELALVSEDPRMRQMGADVLGQVVGLDRDATAEIANVLISRLEVEHDADVLGSVIIAWGHTGDSSARTGVLNYAEHPDENVRYAVAWALPAPHLDDESLAVLRRLSADPDEDVRDWATFGLAESDARDPATTEALAARTDDPHDDTRAEGIFGLARRHDPRARSLIERELSRPVHGEKIEEALEELEA